MAVVALEYQDSITPTLCRSSSGTRCTAPCSVWDLQSQKPKVHSASTKFSGLQVLFSKFTAPNRWEDFHYRSRVPQTLCMHLPLILLLWATTWELRQVEGWPVLQASYVRQDFYVPQPIYWWHSLSKVTIARISYSRLEELPAGSAFNALLNNQSSTKSGALSWTDPSFLELFLISPHML